MMMRALWKDFFISILISLIGLSFFSISAIADTMCKAVPGGKKTIFCIQNQSQYTGLFRVVMMKCDKKGRNCTSQCTYQTSQNAVKPNSSINLTTAYGSLVSDSNQNYFSPNTASDILCAVPSTGKPSLFYKVQIQNNGIVSSCSVTPAQGC